MTNLSIDSYLPSALGFDRMFDVLNRAEYLTNNNTAFPPVNVVRVDDSNYLIEVAVAGYKEDEIDLVSEKNTLRINGKKADKDEREYISKGIAGRSFSREFVLADTVVVRGASLVDGILTVELENVIPEEKKPRKIAINKS